MPHELPATPSEPLEPSSDAELIALSKLGSAAAFGELWARHAAAGRTVARSFTSSLDPDDLVSEAFTRIYQLLLTGKGPSGAFRPYLFTTIRNTAASWGRARREASIDTLETLEDPHSSEEASLAALDNGLTATAFRALPTRWQEVLWYSEVESMTPAQIGPLLGMSANSVAALSYRAREGLRQAWIGAHLNAENLSDDCRWSIERLGGYIRDGLGKRDTARLEKHLDACTKCTIAASEAKDVGSRLTLVLLPLAAGIGGSAAYTHWLQTGGPTSEFALGGGPMPVSVTASGAGSAAGGAAAGSAAGTFAATATPTLVLPTTALAGGLASITAAAVISGLALAASVAALVVGPSLPALLWPSSPDHVLAEPLAPGAPATPAFGKQRSEREHVSTPEADSPPAATPLPTAAPTAPTSTTTPPTPPQTPPGPAAPAVTGLDTGGGALFPVVSGTAEPGATIEFTARQAGTTTAARQMGTAALAEGIVARSAGAPANAGDRSGSAAGPWSVTADAQGNWSATISGLAPGEYRLSSRQITVAGGASPETRSEPFALTAPSSAELAGAERPLGAPSQLTFAGIPGTGLEFSVDAGTNWTAASLDSAGSTTTTLAPLPLGRAGLHARYTGANGRVGASSITDFTIVPIPLPSFTVDTSDGLHFPRFSGSDALPGAESTAVLDLFLGGTVHASATADARGSWTTTVTNIVPGRHTPYLAQRIGDFSSPRVPGAPFLLVEPPTLLGMPDGAEHREDEQPVLYFTGVPDAAVEYSLDGGHSWVAARTDNHGYGFAEPEPFGVGSASVSIRYGVAGRFGPASTVNYTILPIQAPAVPTVSVDTGDGAVFPRVSGLATEYGNKVTTFELFVDGISKARESTTGRNPWSKILNDIVPGTHELTVVAHGENGLSSVPSAPIEFTLLPPPEFGAGFDGTVVRVDDVLNIEFVGVPGNNVIRYLDGAFHTSGTLPASGRLASLHNGFAPGTYTLDIGYRHPTDPFRVGPLRSASFSVTPIPALAAPTVDTGGGRYFPLFSGTGALPHTSYHVLTEVTVDGVAQPKFAADPVGTWATTVTGLAPGEHTATATQWSSGWASTASPETAFTLLAPPALQPELSGSDHQQHVVPPLEFVGVPNAALEYRRAGASAWTAATLDGSGHASVVLATQPVGPVTIDVRYADGAGRVGPASGTSFTVSESPPLAVPTFTVDTVGGRVFPLVAGTDAVADARITVRVDNGVDPEREVTVDADALGAWSIVVDALAPGAYDVTVTQSLDIRESAESAPQGFTLAPPPAFPDATFQAGEPVILDIVGIPDSLAFQSRSEFPNDWALLALNPTTGIETRNLGGFSAGEYWFRFYYVNPGDMRVGPTGESRFTVTPLPTPAAPTVDTGDGRYNPILSGSGAMPNASIQLTLNGVRQSLVASADALGVWSLPVFLTVTPGEHTVSVTQSFRGATSPSSAATVFTVLPPPALQASLAGSTHPEDALPMMDVTGVPNAPIDLRFVTPDSVLAVTAVLDASGRASVAPPALPVGAITASVSYSENGRGGPAGTVSFTVTPRTLAVPIFTVDTAGGLFKPLLSGTDAEPLATIHLKVNGTLLAPVAADANGDWSVTESNVQANVLYQVTASQQLGASSSPVSAPQTFQLKAPQILSPANNSMHSSWGPIGVTVQGEPGAFVAGVLHTGGPVDGKLLYLDGSGGGAMTFNESAAGGWTTGQIEVYYADPSAGGRTGVSTTISVTGN